MSSNNVSSMQYNLFPEENCTLSQLTDRAAQLRENNFTEALELQARIKRQMKRFTEQTQHDYNVNLAENRMPYKPEPSLNANDVTLGKGRNYLLFALPRDATDAAHLFDAALQKNVTLFVSLLESTEARSKFNNYWLQNKLSQVTTKGGWKFAKKSSKILATAPKEPEGTKIPKLIETTIAARHKDGENRVLTHLHYEGWRDREAMPSETLFHALQDRIAQIHRGRDEPFAVNCLGGVGRTGTTVLTNCFRKDIDDQFAQGKDPAKVKINVIEKLFAFKLQRNWFIEQATQLANVYSVLGDYVKMKVNERKAHKQGLDIAPIKIISSYDVVRNLSTPRKAISLPDEDDEFYKFSDQACTLSQLKERIEALRKNDLLGFEEVSDKIDIRFQQFLALTEMEGNKHNFRKNMAIKRMPNKAEDENLNASDVVMGKKRNYMLYACPKTVTETATLFDAILQANIQLIVSTQKSTDAQDRFNNFWEDPKISQITTADGWTIAATARQVLATGSQKVEGASPAQLIETTLVASLKDEKRTLTHLHFDGWDQDKEMPEQALFKSLLDRINELQAKTDAPYAIGSKWGVGRNGTTALSDFLRQEVIDQATNGQELDEIRVNIPKTIFEFRKQRGNFVEHAPLLATVYEALLEYYESLKSLKAAAKVNQEACLIM
jgi:protein tyrosine phosphatase